MTRSPWPYWMLTRGAAVAVLREVHRFGGTSPGADVRGVYFPAGRALAHGMAPYLDFHYEYPPGTLPFVVLGWLLGGHRPGTYTAAWVLLMLLLDAAVLWGLMRLAEGNRRRAATVWLLGGAVLFWACLRNDMVAVAPVVLAFVALGRRPALTGAALAFATVSKLWPGAPLVAMVLARSRGRARMLAGASAVAITAVAGLAGLGALRPMISYLADYQGHRPIEFESSWAALRWVVAAWNGTRLRTRFVDGSRSFTDGPSAVYASLGYGLTTAVAVAVVLAAVLIRVRLGRELTVRHWAWLLAAYILATLVVAPVFSAQYGLWFIGGAALVCAVDRQRAAIQLGALSVLAAALTTAVFPFGFRALLVGRGWVVAALTARTLLLLVALVVAVLGLLRSVRDRAPCTGGLHKRPELLASGG